MSEPATAWARITFCFGIFRSSLRTWTSRLQGGPATWTLRRIDVDAAGRSDDENARLPPELPQKANAQPVKISLELEPYGVALLWGEERRSQRLENHSAALKGRPTGRRHSNSRSVT